MRSALATLLLCASAATPVVLWAQTASEITPETLAPPLQRLGGSVQFTGQVGTEAPPGAEQIGITLSGVDLEDALPQLQAENASFVSRLTRGRIPVSELFEATADLEAAYANAGFVLTRVVLPQQSLRDGGRLRVTVVNGFIERVETANVPEQTRPRIERLTEPLLNKPGLTLPELERQLLLAGDTPGTALRSALGAGEKPGGAIIALDPEFRLVTGFLGFGNPTPDDLGGISLNAGIEINSPLRFGETFYLRTSGSPEGFFTDEPQSRILAAGALVPLGFSGLTLNVEVTASDTTPESSDAPTRSDFDRKSIRLSYPFIRSRNLNVTGQLAFDHQTDEQVFLGGGGTELPIYEDAVSILRLGGSLSRFHEGGAVTEASLTLSRGLDAFGARTAAEAEEDGVALSRQGSDAEFTKLAGSITHQRNLSDAIQFSVAGRFQTSFGDPLVTSEQFTLVGPQELSTFDSGTLRGDSGWVVRSEISTLTQVELGGLPLVLRPYAFIGYGETKIEEPTAVEQSVTTATAFGIGQDIFTQTDSTFRSGSVRLELGRGERSDGLEDGTRFGLSASFRF
ncbi:MAG: ShlB/FhaC/HecB family hemolysin secretion/activation protein [Pseudomonadota bacterium]